MNRSHESGNVSHEFEVSEYRRSIANSVIVLKSMLDILKKNCCMLTVLEDC